MTRVLIGTENSVARLHGRGGPGFTSTNDAHKVLSGPPILGDSSLRQPIGHSLAATAASTLARAFGGSQFSRLPVMQNGLQNFSALGNDPLNQYLAKMSRRQLNEIMSEMKTLATQNKALAQQLLQGCPKLPKAFFQAQIMLGMVTPQMLQMVNTRQPSSLVTQPALQNNIPNQNPLLVGPLTRPPESQVSCTLQNPVILQQSTSIPVQQLPVQPPIQHLLSPQPQTLLPGTVSGKSGITAPPQTFGGLSNQSQVPPRPTSKTLISQVQPPILQQSRTPGDTSVGQHPQSLLQVGLQQSHLLQSGASNYPVLPNRLHSLPKEAGTYAVGSNDLTSLPRGSMHATPGVGLTPQTGTRGEISEVMNHRAKRPKLEDGGGAHLAVTDTFSTISSVPAQPVVPGSVPGSQMANSDGLQHSEKQIPLKWSRSFFSK